jgi:hypothetical protein
LPDHQFIFDAVRNANGKFAAGVCVLVVTKFLLPLRADSDLHAGKRVSTFIEDGAKDQKGGSALMLLI